MRWVTMARVIWGSLPDATNNDPVAWKMGRPETALSAFHEAGLVWASADDDHMDALAAGGGVECGLEDGGGYDNAARSGEERAACQVG